MALVSRVLINFESSSLGDTIAWIPQVEQFRIEKDCHVICCTFHNELFEEAYPAIEFVPAGQVVHNLDQTYRIGVYYSASGFDKAKHSSNPFKQPLGKICADSLGIKYKERRPDIRIDPVSMPDKKRVGIAIHATAQCKYWNNPSGWQTVVNHLKALNYDVILFSKESDGYMGNKEPEGIIKLPEGSLTDLAYEMQQCDFFIGISSGLAWLAWALELPTIIISGFTDPYVEPTQGIHRVINTEVCHGCWGDEIFDRGDWNWCPKLKGTERQFECSKQITAEAVIKEISGIRRAQYEG